MRLLFEKVRRLESEQQRAHQPLWAKPRPGPFTEHILNYHQEKEIQPLRIAFYTGTEDPLTHIHSFQSALGVARPPQRVILLLNLHLLQQPPRPHLNILLPPQTPGMPKHPKRKDSYRHTFNNNKRGGHGNHHQSEA
ncbi:unnamed protein product [Prunus brigantina]